MPEGEVVVSHQIQVSKQERCAVSCHRGDRELWRWEKSGGSWCAVVIIAASVAI